MRAANSPLILACLLFWLAFGSSLVFAQFNSRPTAIPFGLLLVPATEGVELQVPQKTGDDVESAEPEKQTLGALNAAQARVAQLEAAEGPYSPNLGGALLETAQLAEDMGLTEVALEFYAWALHNTRVNQGLNTDTQRPLVETMLALHRQTGDVSAMDKREAYLYRLSGSARPPWDVAKLEAAQRYFRWRQGWYGALRDWRDKDREIAFFTRETREMAESICADPQWGAEWCRSFTYQALVTLYLIDFRINPVETNVAQENLGQFSGGFSDREVRTLVESIERGAFSAGVRLLEAALDVTPDDFDLRLALADWRWTHGRSGSARRMYRELYNEQPARFASPRPLPELPEIPGDPVFAEAADRVRVRAVVTRSGWAREIAFQNGLPDGLRVRTRKNFSKTRFRPALDHEGETVKAPYEAELWSMRIFQR